MGVEAIAKYDWAKIKAEYISTPISLRKLAEKHGIPFNTLKDHALSEKWADAKKATQHKIETETTQKLVSKTATRLARELDKEYAIADGLADVLARALVDGQQFNRYLVKVKAKSPIMELETVAEKQYAKVDMAAVANAVKSLQGIETVKRRIKGVLTEPERQHYDIERDRLELDKRKADSPTGSTADSGVVELAPVLPDEAGSDDDA